MSEVEFWRLTLKQWDALVRRLNKEKYDNQYNLAITLSTIHNVHRTQKSDKIMKPEDFLKGAKTEKSNEELANAIMNKFKMLKNG